MRKIINRLGEKFLTKYNEQFEIIEYINNKNCSIRFDDGTIVRNLQYHQVRKGLVKNYFCKSVYGTGFIGEGTYSASIDGKTTKYYEYWSNMIQRCYDKSIQEKHLTYINCFVTEEWHNFQNFAKWYEDNYNPETMQGWQLDKDILVKGNKIYSPETCAFVPAEINNLFVKMDLKRGEYPIGVIKNKEEKFTSCFTKNTINIWLGTFNTPEEAFQAYKTAKEQHVKEMAEKWKDQIDLRVYQAMYKYEVEITD